MRFFLSPEERELYANTKGPIKPFMQWTYMLAFLVLVTAASIVWYGKLGPGLSYVIFLFVSGVSFIKCNSLLTKDIVAKKFALFVTFFGLIDVYILSGSNIARNDLLGYLFSLWATYLLISRYDFYFFRDILTKVLSIIVIYCLIVFFACEFSLISASSLWLNGNHEYMFWGVHLGGDTVFHRFAGIWQEAGACQIVLNTILWMHYPEISSWTWKDKKQKKCVLIIAFALLCTKSTVGYGVFALLVMASMQNRLKQGKMNAKVFAIIATAFLGLLILFSSDVVQQKLFANADGEDSQSKTMRINENLTLLSIFLDNWFLGAGLGTDGQWSIIKDANAYGASNGILYYLSGLGICWGIPYFLLMKHTLNKYFSKTFPLWFLFCSILMMQCSQSFVEFPISYMFIFPFKSYYTPFHLVREKVMLSE